eukprot:12417158-Karenia_brevis.AAC.1
MDIWEKAKEQREREVASHGTGGSTMPQAFASGTSNPGPLEDSQHSTFPGAGEGDDDGLPSYEEQFTGG